MVEQEPTTGIVSEFISLFVDFIIFPFIWIMEAGKGNGK